MSNLPQCPACAAHPGWATADESQRRDPADVCRACKGSGVAQAERFDIVVAIMAVEDGTASPLETLETLGHLIRTGTIASLQGSWQRMAADAIAGDLLTPDGNLTDHAIAALGDLDETEEF